MADIAGSHYLPDVVDGVGSVVRASGQPAEVDDRSTAPLRGVRDASTTLHPTTWPASLMAKATLSVLPGKPPRSMTDPPLHSVACQIPPTTLNPTTWPTLLMARSNVIRASGQPAEVDDRSAAPLRGVRDTADHAESDRLAGIVDAHSNVIRASGQTAEVDDRSAAPLGGVSRHRRYPTTWPALLMAVA